MVNFDLNEFNKGALEVGRILKKFRDEVEEDIGPILIRTGSIIQAQIQKNAPVLTGTLRRSIHTSDNTDKEKHANDFELAGGGTPGGNNIPETKKTHHIKGKEHTVIVGTWLDYAYERELYPIKAGKNVGRHRYMIRGFEAKYTVAVAYFYGQFGEAIAKIGARAR